MSSVLYLNTYRGYFPCAIHYRKRPIYRQNVNIRIRIEEIQNYNVVLLALSKYKVLKYQIIQKLENYYIVLQ